MSILQQPKPLVPTRYDDRRNDPFYRILRPPEDETPEERRARLLKQQDAQRVSRQIDESILESKKAFDKRKKAIKILLLGQAESGKSTTLKNFQLTFTPNHFRSERPIWRMVIQLNLIRSLARLLQVLQYEWDSDVPSSPVSPVRITSRSPPNRSSSGPLTDEHRRICKRLSPLVAMESELTKQLLPETLSLNRPMRDVCVRAGSAWKGILNKVATFEPPPLRPGSRGGRPGSSDGRHRSDPTAVLVACKDDVIGLWQDKAVQLVLRKHGVRLEEMPGFFLDDVDRIATFDYEPTDDDILRARIRTLGVEEHRFVMDSGSHDGSEWYIYDVGGSRGQRHTWVPYFDDVQAIIFLAPLVFNQTLDEDPSINRLEDTMTLWKDICSNPLLAKATLVLFLNKIDILRSTVAAGVKLKRYVPSYGDEPNDVENITRFFKDKFRAYHKKFAPKYRPLFVHETSVIDTRTTSAIIIGVREGILHAHLKSMSIL
ncbi:G-protein alpha subunit [Gloeophyllum trabeum ATCC 11539]|uniref:G-protein alpha subunit n=1 Tax=Gloeophyllum trabeum (strain ATCC 11539 / FP-39264 / Madison 617) TaxID=670483 RepID=S7RK60_GLOTA|nr:G-protein alpha subunit [Gloeophyllum trabeum ATCC 11539]EPQ53009.1 G-protein alpha subunit [Gloeophyllum trabeum ATCC 11539]